MADLSELATQAAKALEGGSPIDLHLEPSQGLSLLGVLQLALRHPRFSSSEEVEGPRQVALDTAASLQEQLSECGPATAEVCRRGWGKS